MNKMIVFFYLAHLLPEVVSAQSRVFLGGWSTCIYRAGAIECAGDNRNGQTPVGLGFNGLIDLSIGRSSGCATDEDGLFCWGNGIVALPERVPQNLVNPRDVEIGGYDACVLSDEGLTCWGLSHLAIKVPDDLGIPSDFDVGYGYACAVVDQKVRCWGEERVRDVLDVPKRLGKVKQVATGARHSCALHEGKVTCWGLDRGGRLDVPSLSNARFVSAFGGKSCAIDDRGLKCWGELKELEDLPSYEGVIYSVELGVNHGCLRGSTGIKCWGGNFYSQRDFRIHHEAVDLLSTGNGVTCLNGKGQLTCRGFGSGPLASEGRKLSGMKELSINFGTGCAIYGQDKVSCWGKAHHARNSLPKSFDRPEQLVLTWSAACVLERGRPRCWGGANDPVVREMPAVLHKLTDVELLTAYGSRACAKTSSEIVCWGSSIPTGASFPTRSVGVSELSLGAYHGCVIQNSKVHCWGDPIDSGEISIPQLIRPRNLVSGEGFSCVIDLNKVKCWGKPGVSVLEVPRGISNPAKISAGSKHVCVLDKDGVKCWGNNSYGQRISWRAIK